MARDLLAALLLFAGIDFALSAECVNAKWTYFNGACYYFGLSKLAYPDAKKSCAAMAYNANLVSIHSDAEQEFLNDKYENVQYWLGLEATTGIWKWNDGTIFNYTNWHSTYSTAKCPVVNHESLGKWSTILCTRKNLPNQGLLCKYYTPKPTVPTTTAPTTTTTEPCNDKVGARCAELAYLCDDPAYFNLMADECTRTCHRCPSDQQPSTCSDTQVLSCASLAHLCNSATYIDLLTAECPKTCNRCPPPCVDKATAPCNRLSYLCANEDHRELLAVECPRTCGFCTP